MEELPRYYTILPAEIRYNNKLTPLAKLLFSEILTLSMKDGYCYATNSYFAKLYNVDLKTIKRAIALLVKEKYITSQVQYKDKKIIGRHLQVSDLVGAKMSLGRDKNVPRGRGKNVPYNNTSNNNINRIYTPNRFFNEENNITDITKYYDNFKEV